MCKQHQVSLPAVPFPLLVIRVCEVPSHFIFQWIAQPNVLLFSLGHFPRSSRAQSMVSSTSSSYWYLFPPMNVPKSMRISCNLYCSRCCPRAFCWLACLHCFPVFRRGFGKIKRFHPGDSFN